MPCSGRCSAVYSDAAPGWMRHGDFHSTLPVWVGGEIRTGYSCNVILRRASPALARPPLQTSPSARPAARTPNILPQMYEAGGRIAYAPRALVDRAGAARRARASRGWPNAGSAAGRRMAGCSAADGRVATPASASSGWPRPRPSIASRRPRQPSSFRSTATAMRCAASCTPASSSGCSACASFASMAIGQSAREAQQCSLT